MTDSPQIHSFSPALHMQPISFGHGQFRQAKQLYKWFIGANGQAIWLHIRVMEALRQPKLLYKLSKLLCGQCKQLYAQPKCLYKWFIAANGQDIPLFGRAKLLYTHTMGAYRQLKGSYNLPKHLFSHPVLALLGPVSCWQWAGVVILQQSFINSFPYGQYPLVVYGRKWLRHCRPP